MTSKPATIRPAQATFKDGAVYSADYADIYHSVDGAIQEARHVFIAGNDLPNRWQQANSFTIVETGFGCGLNFLATWDTLKQSAAACHLDFVSVEKSPFSLEDLSTILRAWPELGTFASELLRAYPPLIPGFHRFHFDGGKVTLTLLLGDAVEMLSELEARVDAFFLDGFAPARNPEMWSDALFEQVGRIAVPAASAATYSSAGVVRKGLESAGFAVQKKPGYGRKRDMLTAQLPGTRPSSHPLRKAVVIGAGIAGASCAFALARRGIEIELLDRKSGPGGGASFNPAAVVRPFPTLDTGVRGRFTWAAFLYAVRLYRELSKPMGFTWHETGVLQLARDSAHHERLVRAVEMLGYPPEVVRIVNAQEATELCGAQISEKGVWFPMAGFVEGQALCGALVESAQKSMTFIGRTEAQAIRTEGETVLITDADGKTLTSADIAIVANGIGAKSLIADGAPWLRAVRGQLSELAPVATRLRSPVCREGYVTPVIRDRHYVGATFDEAHTDTSLTDEDHEANLQRAARILPDAFDNPNLIPGSGWAAVRCASRDRLPVIGAADLNLYCCLAMGSRGFSWGPLAAETLASIVSGAPRPLEQPMLQGVSTSRYVTEGSPQRFLA
ncbi:MAG: bifunctional tRNA (5-methylaminomethyl-2-thiouridine)(34)-methyltransferase MnmD/FAD-dependent 5-carboxymethylaminomethyl-2-thiouridine(34) oxidoreductase MnmC [Betaproteobacteria bacterium]|nr:MAG: bifunctional tRNA (5-methylaminomethyl-2-thiouridine)(34)-methyltransferase MnmD/FAD-dependent 5-carboxymethylaminomethyl-2-thiouridine(34) oxidoreductase MnmC [Betaproteobacteria bacterium]